MQSAKFDRTIYVKTMTYSTDADGQRRMDGDLWDDTLPVRAQLVDRSLNDTQAEYGDNQNAVVTFRIRFWAGISTSHKIIFQNLPGDKPVLFDIDKITEIGRRRALEIQCVAHPSEINTGV